MVLKNFIKKTLRHYGFDVIRYNAYTSDEVHIQTIIRHFNIDTIFDVGANEGQYAMAIVDEGFQGKIYSFEPLAKVFEVLKTNARKYPNWQVINEGIGSKHEKVSMNVSENLTSSSILKTSKQSIEAEPTTQITHTEVISITTLDKFFTENNVSGKSILLKLDIQGYELEALKGATQLLKKCKLVQAELSFVPVYEGAPLFQDIVDFLKREGFEIFAILPGFMNGKTGQMLQADGIFVNTR